MLKPVSEGTAAAPIRPQTQVLWVRVLPLLDKTSYAAPGQAIPLKTSPNANMTKACGGLLGGGLLGCSARQEGKKGENRVLKQPTEKR